VVFQRDVPDKLSAYYASALDRVAAVLKDTETPPNVWAWGAMDLFQVPKLSAQALNF
jgi:hypothetical protein